MTWDEAIKAYKQGYKVQDIIDAVGVTRKYFYEVLHKRGVQLRKNKRLTTTQ